MKKKTKVILWSLILCLTLGAAGWFGWNWYDNNVDRSGWREKDGVTMYADFHGKPVTGWQEISGSRYYFGLDHALQTGWLTLDGKTYYLGNDGAMHKHWLETDDGTCYLGEDGILVTAWQEIDGNRYYFDAAGFMQTGWQEIGDNRHYFRDDGILHTGWLEAGESILYLDENGTPLSGWQEIAEQTYYFDESSLLTTGWQEIDGSRYYFTETGTLHTGWLETEEGTRYLLPEGPMATGWQEIEGNRYYFADTGLMHTGWLELGEYRYYFHEDGTTAAGPTEVDGETLYFSPKGIWVLLVNPWHPLPDDYEVELSEIEDGWMVSVQALDALKAMFEDMRKQGLYPYFSSTYRNEADQAAIWQNYVKRYMDAGYDEAQANAMTASYVAVPGTSEHHTGLAMDIVGHDYHYSGRPGSTMEVQAWLAEHCWEYGFILRYTAEKQSLTGFAPETWHFRYVGTEVSMDMKDSGLCLEEYLGADKNK